MTISSNTLPEGVWRFSATEPGPHLLVFGGIHGNELTGIEVVRRLRDAFEQRELVPVTGTVTFALGNLTAIEAGERFVNGLDLNRHFTTTILSKNQAKNEIEERARALSELIREADISVDLHSTNKPSPPFVASSSSSEHERIFRHFGYDVVLSDPNYVLAGEPASTDEYADTVGTLGICVETGQFDDVSKVGATQEAVMRILSDLGIVESDVELVNTPWTEYEMKQAIHLDERGFEYAPGRGQTLFEEVQEGDVIGFAGKDPVAFPVSGFLIFPKKKEHFQVGKPVCYIAQKKTSAS